MADSKLAEQGVLSRRDYVLLGLAVVGLVVIGAVFALLQSGGMNSETRLSGYAREVSREGTALVVNSARAAAGLPPDFETIAATAENIDNAIKLLDKETPPASREQFDALKSAWSEMAAPVQVLISGAESYGQLTTSITGITEAIHPEGDAGLSREYQRLLETLSKRTTGTATVLQTASQQLVAVERLHDLAQRVLAAGRDAKPLANRLAQELRTLLANNAPLIADPALTPAVTEINGIIDSLVQAADNIVANVDGAELLLQAAGQIPDKVAKLNSTSSALERRLGESASQQSTVLPLIAYGAVLLSLLATLLFVVLRLRDDRARSRTAADAEARQQQAILGLLDEITNLANGDLTVDVTVTEDFTGAIADSINFTVQTLRGLVGTINTTSEEIVGSAASTQDTAVLMSEASERQAQEIAAAAGLITATSQSLQEVAGRAETISRDAESSVKTAQEGAGTVGRTIQNMASLREQIQDTAKRIKRLGESSQEIGNIIEFINDIAEQTNTLALNASIQAAMAGDAGKGFSVVANEVQRLAERAGSATRQIETLVKTIQADTNEAIISMERSTANVVSGAQSAEEAGRALTRIESASQELARSIQDIAVAARGESAEAIRIAGTMQSIREIAIQTSDSAGLTSQAVGELNALSDKLRESVAGFKLPDAA